MAKDSNQAAPKTGKPADPPQATPKAPADPKPARTVPGIRVVAKRDGFRRGGVAWPKAGIDVPVRGIGKARIDVLRAEPMLIVTDIEIPVAERDE